jgi:NAD(P)-dependent dehydrogenase (short-subunit alcohol dehydrogenase family)
MIPEHFLAGLYGVAGRNVLVTGGTSGIGLMIAEGFVRAGASVFVVSRKAEACSAAEKELSALGNCKSLAVDVAAKEGRAELVAWLSTHCSGGLHVLVNNAGTTWGAPLEQYPEEAWDRVMSLNVKAAFCLSRDLLPLLESAATTTDPARIINVTSIAGEQTSSISAYAYGPSKAALNHLTRVLANEFVSRRITVNAIAPGFFPSRMTAHLRRSPEMEQQLAGTVPMKRLGTMEDVAGLAIYLSSRAGSYMTGAILPLDGAMRLRY